jgi:hypothetical protein
MVYLGSNVLDVFILFPEYSAAGYPAGLGGRIPVIV